MRPFFFFHRPIETTPTPTITITASAASVNEGDFFVLTIETTNYAGSTVNYTITGAGITLEDTDWETDGYFDLVDGSAEMEIGITADATTEGSETMTITVTIPDTEISDSVEIVINDTSVTPTVFFEDSFTDSGALPVNLANHTPDIAGESWTRRIGSGTNYSRIETSGIVKMKEKAVYEIAPVIENADSSASMKINFPSSVYVAGLGLDLPAIVFRLKADNSYISVGYRGSTNAINITTVSSGGTYTYIAFTVASSPFAYDTEYTIDVVFSGSSISATLKKAGTTVATVATTSSVNVTETGRGIQGADNCEITHVLFED